MSNKVSFFYFLLSIICLILQSGSICFNSWCVRHKTVFSSHLWCAPSPIHFSLNPTFLEKMIGSCSFSNKHIELFYFCITFLFTSILFLALLCQNWAVNTATGQFCAPAGKSHEKDKSLNAKRMPWKKSISSRSMQHPKQSFLCLKADLC